MMLEGGGNGCFVDRMEERRAGVRQLPSGCLPTDTTSIFGPKEEVCRTRRLLTLDHGGAEIKREGHEP